MPGTLGSGTFDPMAPAAAPKGLDLPQAGSDVSRTTNALDPLIIERMGGLSQPAVQRTTNALNPSIIERMGLSQPAVSRTTNALAPAPAPASNALAPAAPAQMDEIAKLEANIAMLSGNTDPRAVAIVKGLEKRLEQLQPKVVGNSVYLPPERRFVTASGEKQPPAVQEFLFAQTPEGGNYKGSYQQFLADKSGASRVRSGGGGGGSNRAPTGYRFAPDGQLEPIPRPLTELQKFKLKKEQVEGRLGVRNATGTANELERLTDELAGNPAKGIPRHPGYSKITGIEANIKSLPSGPAKVAEQKLETFKGKIAAFGRQLATQYGKLGNMAVQEWKIVADSIQNIDPSAGNLDEQMRDVVRLARDFEKLMQLQYNDLYGDDSKETDAPAQPSTKGSRTVTRTGTINGKRVVEYSDGSVEYAN
jgi:hypothetical protein